MPMPYPRAGLAGDVEEMSLFARALMSVEMGAEQLTGRKRLQDEGVAQ